MNRPNKHAQQLICIHTTLLNNHHPGFQRGWHMLCAGILLVTLGCQNSSQEEPVNQSSKSKPSVVVVNYPLQYFVERMGGDSIRIIYPMPPDENPASWKPSSKDVSAIQQADLILLNGANYSKWLQTVSLPQSKTVITSESFEDRLIKLEDSFVHRHGPQGKESGSELASIVWLDFQLAKLQVQTISDALIELVPEKAASIQTECTALTSELDELDKSFQSACDELKQTPLIVTSPDLQYMAKRYGLKFQNLPLKPDSKLDEPQSARLRQILKSHSAKQTIWTSAPDDAVRKQLEHDFQLESVVIDPKSFQLSGSPDWLQTMKDNLKTLESIQSTNQ